MGSEVNSYWSDGDMKIRGLLRAAWRHWCQLWHFSWDHVPGIDHHRWESKTEMRTRLAEKRQ